MRKVIKVSAFAFLLAGAISAPATAQTASDLPGKWKGEKEPDRQAEIYLAPDGLYYGKLIYEGGKTENLGKILFKKLKYDASARTFKGILAPPDAPMEINATISFDGADRLKVVGRKFLMTKIFYFIRIK